jgi:hypothetical protein
LNEGRDEALIYHLGSTQPLKCNNNHVYEDREELSVLTRQMNDQKRTLAPKADKSAPVIDENPPEAKIDANITNPIATNGSKGISLIPIDVQRLAVLLGHFTDSSSLFGAVFALNQELQDTKDRLKRSQNARVVANVGSGPKAIGGDVVIQVVIPERHVGPINDIADANGMDMTQYMNDKVENGFDNMWFY